MVDQIIDAVASKLPLGDKAKPFLRMLIENLTKKMGNDPMALVQGFAGKGLGSQMNSWIGTGENESISADQAGQALDPEFVEQAKSQLGMEEHEIHSAAATALPEVINGLTPGGSPQDLIGNLLGGGGAGLGDLGGMLGGLLGGKD